MRRSFLASALAIAALAQASTVETTATRISEGHDLGRSSNDPPPEVKINKRMTKGELRRAKRRRIERRRKEAQS